MTPPYDYHAPEDPDQITEWVHWLSPHWGYLVSLAVAALGIVWRAASLVSEIRALRKDHDKFADEYRRDAQQWRRYVDQKFDAMNARLDAMAGGGPSRDSGFPARRWWTEEAPKLQQHADNDHDR